MWAEAGTLVSAVVLTTDELPFEMTLAVGILTARRKYGNAFPAVVTRIIFFCVRVRMPCQSAIDFVTVTVRDQIADLKCRAHRSQQSALMGLVTAVRMPREFVRL